MSVNHNLWRDYQLNGFKTLAGCDLMLEQELTMLNFVKRFSDVTWCWIAPDTKFKKICQQHISIDNTKYNGVILFGTALPQKTTQSLVNTIQELTKKCDYAYVGINRYTVIQHNLDIALPDSINDSLDTIMHYCNSKFKRLHTFDQVDGNHMVAAHPMDCYGLCK
jgi:hypothetical protein